MCVAIAGLTAAQAFSAGMAGLGTAVSAYGAIQSADAQAKQLEYQKKVSEQNAELARQQSQHASQVGALEAWNTAEKGRQFAARQRATMAGNNVNMATGSPLAVQTDTAGMVGADVAKTRYNAMLQSWGYDAQASQYGSEANGYGAAAGNAKRAGTMNALTSIIGGASTVAGQWDYWKNSGNALSNSISGSVSDWHDAGNAFAPKNSLTVGNRSFYKGFWGIN